MRAPSTHPARRQLIRWWGWLAVATTASCILVSLRYFAVTDFESGPLAIGFRGLMLTAHFTAMVSVALSPVLLLILAWPAPRVAIPVGVLVASALVVAVLVDTQVYQLYRFHINAGVINLLFGGAARETFVFPRTMYLQMAGIVVVVTGVLGVIVAAQWRYVRRSHGSNPVATSIAALLIGSIVAFHAIHAWADVVMNEAVLEQTDVLPLRYAATAKRFVRSLGVAIPAPTTIEAGSRSDRNTLSYPLRPLACTPPSERRNIVVILIDSWRFDQLDAHVTPNIAQLASRSVRFTEHYSGGNATRIGVFSLFYAIPGTYWHRVLAERHGPVVIDELLQQDYEVAVFRAAPLYSPELDRTVFAQVDGVRMKSEGDTPAERDRDLTRDFVGFLDSRADTQPFFALLFYDSPHSFDLPQTGAALPFQPSAKDVNYFTLTAATDAGPLFNRYRNSIHYVDSLVGEALDALRRHGLLDQSILVVTGDHGQEFNDTGRNYWGHGSNYSRYQIGVPMLLAAPDRSAATIGHRTTHYDVMPTLLREYLGCSEPFSTYSVGRSLFEPGGRDPLLLSEYDDFAIAQSDRIAVIDKLGMQVYGTDWSRSELSLDSHAIGIALEQKSRFYRRTHLATR